MTENPYTFADKTQQSIEQVPASVREKAKDEQTIDKYNGPYRRLDDGPDLPRDAINYWKNPLIIKAWEAGLSVRAVGKIFDVSHDKVHQLVKCLKRPKEPQPEAVDLTNQRKQEV